MQNDSNSDGKNELLAYDGFYIRDHRGVMQPDVYEWASFMIEKYKFIHSERGNFVYSGTHYRPISDSEIEYLLSETTLNQAKPNHRAGFIKTLLSKAYKPMSFFDKSDGLINLENGIFDIRNDKLLPHTHEIFFNYCLDTKYDASATCDEWMAFLDRIFPDCDEFKIISAQIFGYILYGGDPWLHKAFVLYGEGRNGKSTFLHILQRLIGKNNFSSVSLSNINKPFSAVNLDGKLANIVGESPTDKINAEIFKEATSGGYITASKKYQDEYEFECQARFIFACNDFPKFGENTVGMQERLYFIPFNRYFEKHERDGNIKFKLETELPGILNWAISGLASLLEQKYLPDTDATQHLMDEYNVESDSVYAWAKEAIRRDDGIVAPRTSKDLYSIYRTFCDESGRHAVGINTFAKRFKKYLRFQSWFDETIMFNKEHKYYRYLSVAGSKQGSTLDVFSYAKH